MIKPSATLFLALLLLLISPCFAADSSNDNSTSQCFGNCNAFTSGVGKKMAWDMTTKDRMAVFIRLVTTNNTRIPLIDENGNTTLSNDATKLSNATTKVYIAQFFVEIGNYSVLTIPKCTYQF